MTCANTGLRSLRLEVQIEIRPDQNDALPRQIINLPATRLRTLGHYWDTTSSHMEA